MILKGERNRSPRNVAETLDWDTSMYVFRHSTIRISNFLPDWSGWPDVKHGLITARYPRSYRSTKWR
ncbi:hypothetical protein SGPA1_12038 [Streptomyces misionensis JCM 4497]